MALHKTLAIKYGSESRGPLEDDEAQQEAVHVVHRHHHHHHHHHYVGEEEAMMDQAGYSAPNPPSVTRPSYVEDTYMSSASGVDSVGGEDQVFEEHTHLHSHQHSRETGIPAKTRLLINQARCPSSAGNAGGVKVDNAYDPYQMIDTRLPRLY